jgi:OOP family OmpA-OmpF porin
MPAYTAQLVVTSKNGTECKSDPVSIPVKFVSSRDRSIVRGDNKTLEKYNLILFPFDRYDAGPMNERILKEYVFGRVKDNSIIKVDGHTDVVGMFDHNKRLSENRAKTVRTAVERATGGKFAALEARGTGEEEPLYTNDLPEGRFFNRTVQVEIQTPITEAGTTN